MSKSNFSRFKWVFLENIYKNWDNPIAMAYFHQYLDTKKRGFELEYPVGVVPFDKFDFISNIFLIMDTKMNRSVSVLKFNTQTQCSGFQLENELGLILKSNGMNEHYESVKHIFDQAQKSGGEVIYLSSWTIAPEYREDPEVSNEVKTMICAAIYLLCEKMGAKDCIAGGSKRFKVPRFLATMGFEEIHRMGGGPLPPVRSPFLLGEESVLYHLKSVTEFGIQSVKKCDELWRNRELFLANSKARGKAAA